MAKRPIGPAAHGAVDNLFAALHAPPPRLFGLAGPYEPRAPLPAGRRLLAPAA